MQTVKRDFNDRADEINIYYNLLENITEKDALLIFPADSDRRERLDIKISSTLKSAAVLILYNIVESTVSNCLREVHDAFSSDNLHYNDLSEDIQSLWLKHYCDTFKETSSNTDNLLKNLKVIVDAWVSKPVPINLSYNDILNNKKGSQFSGNLDAKAVRDISDRYGINFSLSDSALKEIKEKRNKLAHGELSFADCCNLQTFGQMKALKDSCIYFLSKFIIAVEDYIDNKKYKT